MIHLYDIFLDGVLVASHYGRDEWDAAEEHYGEALTEELFNRLVFVYIESDQGPDFVYY